MGTVDFTKIKVLVADGDSWTASDKYRQQEK